MAETWNPRTSEDSRQRHAFEDYLLKIDPWKRTVPNAYKHHMAICITDDKSDDATQSMWSQWSVKHEWKQRTFDWETHLTNELEKEITIKRRSARRSDMHRLENIFTLLDAKLQLADADDIPTARLMQMYADAFKQRDLLLQHDLDPKHKERIAAGNAAGGQKLIVHYHSPPKQSETGDDTTISDVIDATADIIDDPAIVAKNQVQVNYTQQESNE